MRVYYVEVLSQETWVVGAKRFTSCRKATSAARHSRKQPTRVLMVMEPSNIKLPKEAS